MDRRQDKREVIAAFGELALLYLAGGMYKQAQRCIDQAFELDRIVMNGIIESRYSEDQPRDEQGRWTSGGGGSGTAHDSGKGNIAITDEAIANVPNVNIFDDKEKNARYQQANKDLLKEAQKHPVGTEVSRVYGADMKPIVVKDDEGKIVREYGYTVGDMGSVKIDDPGVPYHAFHNHPSGETLSPEDLIGLSKSSNMLSLTAVGNDGSIYQLSKTKGSNCTGYKLFLYDQCKQERFLGKFSYFTVSSKSFDKSKLTDAERAELKNQLSVFCENCTKGGAFYGFNYRKK